MTARPHCNGDSKCANPGTQAQIFNLWSHTMRTETIMLFNTLGSNKSAAWTLKKGHTLKVCPKSVDVTAN